MKSCPACKRTFEDTTVFCLVDGSILSAPFDPDAPQQTVEPPPTEVMKAPRESDSAQSTITSHTPLVTPTIQNGPAQSSNVSTNNNRKFLFIGAGVAIFGLFVSAALLFIFLGSSSSCPTLRASCYPYTDYATCSVQVDERSVTSNNSFDTSSLICSLNQALAFQAPSLPNSVTSVSWSASNGKLKTDPTYKGMTEIDTTGLAGREITVTAKVSGYSWRCSNTVSASFIAK